MSVVTPVNRPNRSGWRLPVAVACGCLLLPAILQTALVAAQEKGRTDAHLAAPTQASLLIEPVELESRLQRKRLRMVDTRSRNQYVQGHIPGAVWVNVSSWRNLGRSQGGFHNAKAWGQQVGRLGIDDNWQVVVYGSRLPDTARIWWTFKYLGLHDVRILNGGWDGWIKEHRPTSTATPKIVAVDFVPKFEADRLEEIGTLKTLPPGFKITLVDTRSRDEFTGKEIRGKRGGHIPGATHLEWKALLSADGRFKTSPQLRDLFRQRGILPEATAVCY